MPTDTELRAAAERLRENKYDDHGYLDGIYDSTDKWEDQEVLAAAYLATHRPDNELPVDEEWCRGMPFRMFRILESDYMTAFYTGPEECIEIITEHAFLDGVTLRINGVAMLKSPTRGQVRQLAQALGIELEES